MAYTIPVLALIADSAAVEKLLNLPSGFMDDYANDRYEVAGDLTKLTGAPFDSFSDEDGEMFYIGIRLEEEFEIVLDAPTLAKEGAIKAKYPHPLVQALQLTVVSQFC